MNEMLDDAEVRRFIEDGFLRIDGAFPRELADAGREIMWRDLPHDPEDPKTWTQAVVRLNGYGHEPFRKAVNAPRLLAAYDRLVGVGRWLPRQSIGTFPVRFPGHGDPGDTGWHAEASFEGKDGSWRLNVTSRERALLMLFLFSDVEEDDAPTRIRVGSHLDVPKLLAPAGEEGLSFLELGAQLAPTEHRPVALATGAAGTVYLCHPFLIHAAQPHRGRAPRFMGQPPLLARGPLQLEREDGDHSPVEIAVRAGLGLQSLPG